MKLTEEPPWGGFFMVHCSTMRVILVEVPDLALEAPFARSIAAHEVTDLEPARGGLADREVRPEDHDPAEGEPW